MKAWWTVSELIGRAGLPNSRGKLLARATREGWVSRPRAKGKGSEFAFDSLPEAVRQQLASCETLQLQDISAELCTRQTQDQRQQRNASYMALPPAAREQADKRLQFIQAIKQQQRAGHSLNTACAMVACEYGISERSVWGWWSAYKKGGLAALADKRSRTASSKIDEQPELRDFILAMLVEYPHTSATNILDAVGARGFDQPPSLRRLQAWLANWRSQNAELLTAVHNPDQWKNKYMSALGSASDGITRVNQRWELDSTPADLLLAGRRYSVLGVIDVASRRTMFLVSETSKSSAVCLLLRRAILAWGVPESVKTDNGQDYTSRHVARALASLNIEQLTCNPFSGWEKPHIERVFRSFNHSLVELLPGYTGHNIAERKAIDARKSFAERLLQKNAVVELQLTAADFQLICDRWTNDIYQHKTQTGLGKSPFEAAASCRYPRQMITDERALDIMLAEAPGDGFRTVGKKGISIDNIFYIAPELAGLVGQRVEVRLSERLGVIYVFNHDGFVCLAQAPDYIDIDRQAIAKRGRELQKKSIEEKRREIKALAKKQGVRDIADDILASSQKHSAQLAHFPAPRKPHAAERQREFEQAAEQFAPIVALDALTSSDSSLFPPPASKKTKDSASALGGGSALGSASTFGRATAASNLSVRDNYQRWMRVKERITQGFVVSDDERAGLALYMSSEECRSVEDVIKSFGNTANDAYQA